MSTVEKSIDSKSIYTLLEKFRAESKSSKELGDRFEILIKKALILDPSIAGKFEKVWLWNEFPYKDDTDTGIDLVGYSNQGNQYIAIQCKCYNETTYLKDISTFIAKANTTFKVENKKTSYSGMILFSTTNAITSHAQISFSKQKLSSPIITVSDLNKSKIDWSKVEENKLYLKPKKDINERPYQPKAIKACIEEFKKADRGKLIMACGTGKTFTSLKFTEAFNKKGDFVLFLVPSIALMSQTIREWLQETDKDLHTFAVCSDKTVGKNKKSEEEDLSLHDIPYLATTDIKLLKEQIKNTDKEMAINVIFSTYQSIDVIIEAQKKKILPKFNLTICDEAHRTTGFNLGTKESHFTKVHHNILSSKKLYMTATPRIYKAQDKTQVKVRGGDFYSMDEEEDYGKVFFKYGFSKAVEEGFLSDYKVMVLAIPDKVLSKNKQQDLKNEDQEIEVSDRAKIIGCYQGLQKKYIDKEKGIKNPNQSMKRAVAFVRTIKDSERLVEKFQTVVEEENMGSNFKCSSQHIDGSMNSGEREVKISWLKEEPKKNECRILFNARCLSEGVDVPALDSVIFLNPKGSEIEVVQSVGRVMRKAEGKKYGYIIIPVVIPSGIKPSEALKDNKKYKVIWQVIQALRSHDDKLKNEINKIEFNEKSSKIRIKIIGEPNNEKLGETDQLNLDLHEWKDAIYGQLVLKCGDRMYWDDWAKDVSTVAKQYVSTIEDLLKKDPKRKAHFDEFLKGLKKMLNPSIEDKDGIKLVAQHLVSKPIFDSLFSNSRSLENSSIFQGIEKFVKEIDLKTRTDFKSLNEIYKTIGKKITGISTLEGKQKLIKELYSKFFEKSFVKDSQKLGVVYTPIPAIDFILNSVEDLLNKEFKESLNDRDLNILEPFSGSGTFITRLLQSRVVKSENYSYKFENDIYANEILLLAHYISQVNIEETFSSITSVDKTFNGGVLTDTFQLEEIKEIKQNKFFPLNTKKIEEQKQKDFRVIIGNPPYSVGQKSENDANKNTVYPKIRSRIEETYAKESTTTNKNSLYDSYVQAFRLASDKIKDKGVISFIHNASLLESGSGDGFRKCLEKEFDSIYLLNLRGNQRTKAKVSRKEGGKFFGGSSRTPICITFLIKNKANKKEKAEIF